MKNILFAISIAFLFLSAHNAVAQEMLLPLKYNPAYLLSAPNAKGFQQDFSYTCSKQPTIVATANTLPSCSIVGGNPQEVAGSFTVTLNNGVGPFNFSLKYRNPLNGQFTTATSEQVNNNSYTFDNMPAAAYYISVFDAASSVTFTQNFVLADQQTEELMPNGTWYEEKGYCSEPGHVRRATVAPIAAQLRLYQFNAATNTVSQVAGTGSSPFVPVASAPLAAGQYFIEATTNDACNLRTFYMFEIENEPTISLPFVDDFSTSYLEPDAKRWADNYAYINNDMATNPYTVGVATLDGFNQYGQPYEPIDIGTGLIDGSADVLTSRPACLEQAGIEVGDVLYLSFFYEPQGWGDFPNTQDSLILELLGLDGEWHNEWRVPGPNQKSDNPTFAYIEREITNPNFLYEGFQFRFRNKATVSGANDHWHIDYVVLDTVSRNANRQDVAFPNIPGSMVKTYQAMPWSHFKDNIAATLATEANVPVTMRNLSESEQNRTLKHTITDVCSKAKIYQYNAGTADGFGNIPLLSSRTSSTVFINTSITDSISEKIAFFDNRDSVVLENKWEIGGAVVADENIHNDTVYRYQKFFNYYAYDDGTAEKAYGLNGTGAKLAYRFVSAQPDTLRAIQINFVNMNGSIENYDFKLTVWKKVDENLNTSEVLYQSDALDNPHFYNQTNGFWTYVLPQAVAISDTFYVGYEQTSNTILTMGYDHNTPGGINQNLFYNTSGAWYYSLFDGALMMRPVLGAALPQGINIALGSPSVPAVAHHQLNIYPNPATDQLFVRLDGIATKAYSTIYDFSGRAVATQTLSTQGINVGNLPTGMYVIRAFDEQQNELGTAKFMKY